MIAYLPSLIGGVMIGGSAILFLMLTGRIAGISGIIGRLAEAKGIAINAGFVVGLMLGPILYLVLFGAFPQVSIAASLPLAVLAGLLVGFGSRMGSGCTSGHGVLGLARLSPRSMVAVVTFVLAGMVTVTILRGSL